MALPELIAHHIYTGQQLPEPWPYDYVLDRRGVVKRASTPHFTAALRVAPTQRPLPGLKLLPTGLHVARRIPHQWLYRVLDHARAAGEIEAMYHFHFIDGEYRVAVPHQNQGRTRLTYRGGDAASIVLDLHSHHAMPAYFSAVDDCDEQGCRLYAVIGRIFHRPQLRLRLGLYGDFVELDPLALFSGYGPFTPEVHR